MQPDTPALCPACGVALASHWQCQICRCFGHKNVRHRYNTAICKACDKALAARGVRRCRVCEQIKPLAKFQPNRTQCRACINRRYRGAKRDWERRWRAQNRELYNEQRREYYHRRRDKNLVRLRERYQIHREKHLERHRAYNIKRRAQRSAYMRERYLQKRDELIAKNNAYRIRVKLAILRGER